MPKARLAGASRATVSCGATASADHEASLQNVPFRQVTNAGRAIGAVGGFPYGHPRRSARRAYLKLCATFAARDHRSILRDGVSLVVTTLPKVVTTVKRLVSRVG